MGDTPAEEPPLRAALAAARGGGRWLWHGARELLAGVDPPRRLPEQARWFRRRLPLLLAFVALVVALFLTGAVAKNVPVPEAFVLPTAVLIALPLALLLRWPLMAWRIAFLTAVGLRLWAPIPHSAWPWYPVELFLYLLTIAVVGARRSRAALVLIWVLTVIVLWFGTVPGHNTGNAIGGTVVVTILAIAADASGSRVRAQRALHAEAERTELEQARRAVLEERTRIAREMHDVVAHHMSLIAVQAETAPYRLPGLSDPARDEFGQIGTAARSSLAEMRRLLGVLRSERPADRAPQPGLDGLDELVDGARRAGMTVTLTVDGEPRAIPDAVGLSGYRIVQESLANAGRHAPGAPVTVRVAYRPAEVHLRVDNAPPPTPADRTEGHGHGLIGMRERATLLGGTLTAERTPAGGFRVDAVLPCDATTENPGDTT